MFLLTVGVEGELDQAHNLWIFQSQIPPISHLILCKYPQGMGCVRWFFNNTQNPRRGFYFNYLLHKNKSLQSKYDFIKSGTKIKYYYCKDKSINDTFAYVRGSFPLEFAPDIDLDVQFEKCILSPINSIIEPLGLPTINKRLSVIMDIFSNGF